MPQAKRERRERTDNYHLLQQWCRTPEQRLYEGIRPVVLFGIPPTERAQETGLAARSLGRAADAFDTHGIISLFRPTKEQREDHHRSLPVAMRQLIVDLKAEYADFTDGEIAAICAIQFSGRSSLSSHRESGVSGWSTATALRAAISPLRRDWHAKRTPPGRDTPPRSRLEYFDDCTLFGRFSHHDLRDSQTMGRGRSPRTPRQIACEYEQAGRGLTDAQPHSQKARRESVAWGMENVCCPQAVRHFRFSANLWTHHGRESSALLYQAATRGAA